MLVESRSKKSCEQGSGQAWTDEKEKWRNLPTSRGGDEGEWETGTRKREEKIARGSVE